MTERKLPLISAHLRERLGTFGAAPLARNDQRHRAATDDASIFDDRNRCSGARFGSAILSCSARKRVLAPFPSVCPRKRERVLAHFGRPLLLYLVVRNGYEAVRCLAKENNIRFRFAAKRDPIIP